MDKLVWEAKYNIGIGEIDAQHKYFFVLLDELGTSVRSMSTEKKFDYFYKSLVDYTNQHFAFEEELFHKYTYPETEKHIKEHEQFKEYLKEIKERIDNNEVLLAGELVLYLKIWFKHHILTTDMAYGPFLNEKISRAD